MRIGNEKFNKTDNFYTTKNDLVSRVSFIKEKITTILHLF